MRGAVSRLRVAVRAESGPDESGHLSLGWHTGEGPYLARLLGILPRDSVTEIVGVSAYYPADVGPEVAFALTRPDDLDTSLICVASYCRSNTK